MEVVGQEAFRHNTSLYYVKLTDNLEKPYNLKPIGIDHIASTSCRVNLTYALFPHNPSGALDRPGGNMDITHPKLCP